MDIWHFIYPFTSRLTFELFPLFWLLEIKLPGTFIYTFWCGYLFFISLRCIPRNEHDRSYGNSMFNLLGKYQTLFQTGWNILHSHSSVWGVEFFHILTKNCYYLFFKIAIPMGMKWYLIVALICISLMPNDFEHCLMCLFVICIYWEGNVYSDSLPNFLIFFF